VDARGGGVWGIVVAAGSGDRFGAPKQFCDLAGMRVVDRALVPVVEVCDGVVLVLPPGVEWDGVGIPVVGGDSRSASVRAGLARVPPEADVVVVHDAARPLAPRALFDAVIAALRSGVDGAVPAIPMSDTMKRVVDGRVVETVQREGVMVVQTPQAFRAEVLRRAHSAGGDATDDAAFVEGSGGRVVVVPGDPRNIKITGPTDLVIAAALLEKQQ